MDYNKIERTFSDFIINLVGPNSERDKARNEKFLIIKKIMDKAIQAEIKEYIPHIFTYGSFPIKTYMKDADIDITIIFEDIKTHKLVLNVPFEIISNTIVILKNAFETFNFEENMNVFTEINIIYAEVRLLKCKYENLSLDISVNNLTGISKILFMSYIEKNFDEHINNYSLFKRTLLLIKSWAYYEGNLIGSNIGLMASYALEVLVIYLFNNYSHLFTSEIQAFFSFFHILGEMDWDHEILHIFGTIKNETFLDGLKTMEKMENIDIEPFWYLDYENIKDYPYALNFNKTLNYIQKIEKILGEEKGNKFFTIKNMNILDPVLCNNNLGKSINFHCFSRIKKVFQLVNKEIEEIIKIRNKMDPFLYINSLLKLFKRTITNNFIDLFTASLDKPSIIINPNKNDTTYNLKCTIEPQRIQQFNSLFVTLTDKDRNIIGNISNNKSINYDEYDIIVTKAIMDRLLSGESDINNVFGKLSILEGGNYKESLIFFTKFGYI